jgi:spore germination cell wall hydrolase CwlJ-like protein
MEYDSVFWLAVNAYHEARGEPREGKIAVCHVVMNRMEKKGKTAKEIILASMQFSWYNEKKFKPLRDYYAFIACLEAVEATLLERRNGKTLERADHYFNPYKVLPKWAAAMTHIVTINNHAFYRE